MKTAAISRFVFVLFFTISRLAKRDGVRCAGPYMEFAAHATADPAAGSRGVSP